MEKDKAWADMNVKGCVYTLHMGMDSKDAMLAAMCKVKRSQENYMLFCKDLANKEQELRGAGYLEHADQVQRMLNHLKTLWEK